jgi:hypothetical protein
MWNYKQREFNNAIVWQYKSFLDKNLVLRNANKNKKAIYFEARKSFIFAQAKSTVQLILRT